MDKVKTMLKALEKIKVDINQEIKRWAQIEAAKFEKDMTVQVKSLTLSVFEIAFTKAYDNNYDKQSLIDSIVFDDYFYPQISYNIKKFKFLDDTFKSEIEFNQNDSGLNRRMISEEFRDNKQLRMKLFSESEFDLNQRNEILEFTDGNQNVLTQTENTDDNISQAQNIAKANSSNLDLAHNGINSTTMPELEQVYQYARSRAQGESTKLVEENLQKLIAAYASKWKK